MNRNSFQNCRTPEREIFRLDSFAWAFCRVFFRMSDIGISVCCHVLPFDIFSTWCVAICEVMWCDVLYGMLWVVLCTLIEFMAIAFFYLKFGVEGNCDRFVCANTIHKSNIKIRSRIRYSTLNRFGAIQ